MRADSQAAPVLGLSPLGVYTSAAAATCVMRIFSHMGLHMLLPRDLPALFKSGCGSAPCGDVCAVTFLYCFYFSSFNACSRWVALNTTGEIDVNSWCIIGILHYVSNFNSKIPGH